MPFQSEKQRRYLHANHPEIAKRWEKEYFNGGIANHFRKKFDKGSDYGQFARRQAHNVAAGKHAMNVGSGGGGGNNNNPPRVNIHKGPSPEEIAIAKAKAEAEKRRLEAEANKKYVKDFKDTQKKKIKKFEDLVKTKGYDSTIATDEEKKLYDDWMTATGEKEKIGRPMLINSKEIEEIQEKDGKSKTFITSNYSLEDLMTGDIDKETYIETPELGSVSTFLNPENAKGPQSWAVNPGEPRFTIEELKAKGLKNGGILDIDGSEEITTEEGNDISLVDESETGVSTLFKEKNNDYAVQGGVKNYLGEQEMVNAPKHWQSAPDHPKTELTYITDAEKDLLVKADLHGSLHGSINKGPSNIISLNGWGDAEHGFGSSGNTDTGGGSTNRELGIQKAYEVTGPAYSKEQQRKEDLSNLVKSGPGSWEEKFDTEKQIVQGAGATDLKRAQIKTTLVRDRVTPRINELKAKIQNRFTPAKMIGNIVARSFPVISFATSLKDQWEISALTKELVEALEAEKEQHLKAGHAPFHHAVDTPIQTIDQEILDLTQKDTRDDEDTKGDGPEVPVVAPVTEEIEDSYAMAGDWLQSYRDLKAKQALSASLQEKWADEREWQQNTMFANSGGLANLFRVKNY